MQTINTAQREYFNRPADERYPTLPAMLDVVKARKHASREVSRYSWRDLSWQAQDGGLVLQSPNGNATLTHWAFGQAARELGAPAGFLRDNLSPQLAADVLNYRTSLQSTVARPHLLLQLGAEQPKVRAITSDSYSRIYDYDLYQPIQQRLGHKWTAPPVWGGGTGGIYTGDRSSFVILHEGGSIVTDPSAGQGDSGALFRALLVRNSEVGQNAVSIESILYRFICGNHMLWGAVVDRTYRRRHVGQNALRDTLREVHRLANAWAGRSAQSDEQIIRGLIDRELAKTYEDVISELQAIGYSKADAEASYTLAQQKENASPRSYWGIAQGTTRLSQQSGYQDERYELDRLAAAVLARGRKLVAA